MNITADRIVCRNAAAAAPSAPPPLGVAEPGFALPAGGRWRQEAFDPAALLVLRRGVHSVTTDDLDCLLDTPPEAAAAPGPALRRLVLASTSPRRRELLAARGYAFEVRSPGVDDADLHPGDVGIDAWVSALAYLKASAVARELRPPAGREPALPPPLVLGADTLVLHRDRVLSKPRSVAEAAAMIRLLREDQHDVVTGVALVDASDDLRDDPRGAAAAREIFLDRATVALGPIDDAAVDAYAASGRWQGKAGGYNLEEQLRAGWPITWEGDATTIVGLPMAALARRLARWGIAPSEPA